ncbi:general substrate transporter [Protomyces lactucae-debilis]|uniref:General substrate transporter n=1 Tax=Protomyces lactucae-debilis TaxID=2754530 RepID=A0A1Y2EYD2_PROLT|nr:general substrate transporter [Protomyces lactucae-debilis]ORY76598.1 general substrate transporter [Protomyces lactucae-debilis]
MGAQRRVVIFSSLALALYGFDQGMLSLVNTNTDYLHTMGLAKESPMVGVIVSVYYLAAAVGALLASKVADTRGRKTAIYCSLILTTLGNLIMFTAGLGPLAKVSPLATMIVGRVVLGLGIGGIDAVIPVYSSELAESGSRGKALAQEFQANIGGLNLAFALNLVLTQTLGKTNEWAWRVPIVSMQIFPLALLSVLHKLPESPRYLISNSEHEAAREALETIYGEDEAESKLKSLQKSADEEGDETIDYKHMLNPKDDAFHPTVITIMGQVNQALTGIGALSVYGPQLFELLGRSTQVAEYLTMGNYVLYFAAMTLAWVLIDKLGRRRLLISGAFTMAAGFLLLTVFAYLAKRYDTQALFSILKHKKSHSGKSDNQETIQTGTSIAGIILLYAITSTFGITSLCPCFLIPSEIFPITARAQGSAISVVIWGISNFAVTLMTPILFNTITYGVFAVFAATNLFSALWTWLYLPESGGRSFEENQAFFKTASDEGSWRVKQVDKQFLGMPRDDEHQGERSRLLGRGR